MKFPRTAVILSLTSLLVTVSAYSRRSLVIRNVCAKSESARKVDEYGDLIQDDENVRLNAFAKELANDPSARGCIIVYGGGGDPPGKPRRYALRAKNYLVSTEGVRSDRIITIGGGQRGNLTVELWIVPGGARPPVPNPSVAMPGNSDEAWKYDEYSYGYEFSWNSFEVPSIRLDGFAEWLRSHPNSRGYIVAYAQNRDDRQGIRGDRFGEARRIAVGEKVYLTKMQRISPKRLVTVDGGYSNKRTVVLWIVPAGAPPPRVRRA